MRLMHINEYDLSKKSILFMNGGGQAPFSRNNRLVKYFVKFDLNLIAVELPGHGKSSFSKILEPIEFIDHFRVDLMNLIQEKEIRVEGLVGFSIGGLLALKIIELNLFEVKFVIGFGCGFGIAKSEEDTFNYYTSEKFFVDMNWMPIMKRNHGAGWKNLLYSIDKIIVRNSPIFSDPALLNHDTNILIILGENEELFTPAYMVSVMQRYQHNSIHLNILPETSHFEYTTKSWSTFVQALEIFFKERKLTEG